MPVKPNSEQLKVKQALKNVQNAGKRFESAKAALQKAETEYDNAFEFMEQVSDEAYGQPASTITEYSRDLFGKTFELDYDRLHNLLTDPEEIDAALYE